MRTNAIVFDLDDTLIDTRRRHFNVVNDFLLANGRSLDFGSYLNMRKKDKLSNREIVKQYYSLNEDEFSSFWNINIENPDYLEYDIEVVDSALLKKLKNGDSYDFILLSLRSNIESAIQQFIKFNFSSLIDEYIFLKHADLNPKIEKIQYYKALYQQIIFISDSQDDCNAAATAGVEFVGVRSGVYPICCNSQFEDINSFLLKHNYD